VIWAIVVLHFVVPFFLLLMRSVKANSKLVARIAALILVMQLVFMYYQTMPGLSPEAVAGHWMDLSIAVGLGGVWLACFLWQLQRRPQLAPNDYNRDAALHLRHLDEEEAAREEALAYG
jgi:heme A synthase